MNKKIALIFGVTGQDGSYLAEFLLKKKYIVHGVKRRSSSINTARIDHIYQEPSQKSRNFFLHYGDITDSTSVSKIIRMIKPHEIYNLAAMSHVHVSFDIPEYVESAPDAVFQEMREPVRVLPNWQPLLQGGFETLHRAADRVVVASGQFLFRTVHLARASLPGLVGVIP